MRDAHLFDVECAGTSAEPWARVLEVAAARVTVVARGVGSRSGTVDIVCFGGGTQLTILIFDAILVARLG